MTIAINAVTISGGPLPEGNLCAYSYDPSTSCVYLARLLDEVTPSQVATKSWNNSAPADVVLSTALYAGIIKLKFLSTAAGIVGKIKLQNSANQVIFDSNLVSSNNFDQTILSLNTFGYKINDDDTYTLTITCNGNGSNMANIQLVELEVPTGVSSSTVYNSGFNQSPALTGISSLTTFTATISNYNPLNTSWGYIRKHGRHLALQTLAPFPPPFYDTEWFNPIDYPENTSYIHDFITYKAQEFYASETFTSTPDLSKAVKLIDDIHARPTPTCYSIAIVTQEDVSHQLMWRCIKQTRILTIPSHGDFTYYLNTWVSSEKVYKYKAGGIFFGGKDYSGPLNSILVDSQDGLTFSEYKILDLNEFPISDSGEVYVHAYVCNYNSSASKIYCVLNKQSGRMAEIDVTTKTVKYFTVVVPVDNEICQLYYTNRLMYTIKNATNTVFSLYDANQNGVLVPDATFNLGTYNPALVPQFTIIN